MTLDPALIDNWKSAIGRSQQAEQLLDRQSLRKFSLALGLAEGSSLPPLAHWAYFLPEASDDKIGEDGHPERGDFLPAITLPQRMFAASSTVFEAPLELETPARLTSTITGLSHKSGQSGDLIFAEVQRDLEQDSQLRIREAQTYVYRAGGAALAMPEPLEPPPEGICWRPEEVNLFRFSAATFNSHRIHYDLPYAQQIEHYPALVIHGPFTACKLAGLAVLDGEIKKFSFRAKMPLFHGQNVYLQRGRAAGEYHAVRADGAIAMAATAEFK